MILIGENINIISKTLGTALRDRITEPVREMARLQAKAGMDYIELNVGPARKGGDEMMAWAVNTVREVTDLPLSLDTSNPLAMEAGLKEAGYRFDAGAGLNAAQRVLLENR